MTITKQGFSAGQRRAILVALASAALLVVPLLAMPFTSEVDWGVGDFVAAATLLCGAGMLFTVAMRQARSRAQRITLAVLIPAVPGIIRAELAVGLFS